VPGLATHFFGLGAGAGGTRLGRSCPSIAFIRLWLAGERETGRIQEGQQSNHVIFAAALPSTCPMTKTDNSNRRLAATSYAKTASAKEIRIPSPSRFCLDPSSIYLDPLILLPYACLGHVCAADRFCRLIACQRCTVVTKVIGPLRHYFLPDWADELCHDGGWATDVGHSTNDHGAHVQEDFTA
jgi:hypothetical protein